MKAAVLEAFGKPLSIQDVPPPILGTGEVIVDVFAAPILSYAGEVFSGERKYLLPPPVIPGCGAIGRVRETGPDAVLDLLPPSAEASAARNAIMSVRPYGRAVLMGGVGMLGGDDLALPYPWIMRNLITIKGQWMYEHEAVYTLVGLIRAGLLDLSHYAVTEFTLSEINHAIIHAAENSGPFKLTVVRP